MFFLSNRTIKKKLYSWKPIRFEYFNEVRYYPENITIFLKKLKILSGKKETSNLFGWSTNLILISWFFVTFFSKLKICFLIVASSTASPCKKNVYCKTVFNFMLSTFWRTCEVYTEIEEDPNYNSYSLIRHSTIR